MDFDVDLHDFDIKILDFDNKVIDFDSTNPEFEVKNNGSAHTKNMKMHPLGVEIEAFDAEPYIYIIKNQILAHCFCCLMSESKVLMPRS